MTVKQLSIILYRQYRTFGDIDGHPEKWTASYCWQHAKKVAEDSEPYLSLI